MSSKRTFVPSTTHVNGDWAIKTGIFKFCFNTFCKPFNSEPPPVNITPLSTISAANSGGVFSKTLIETLTIFLILSSRALAVSSWFIVIVIGRPVIKFLPFTINSFFLSGL